MRWPWRRRTGARVVFIGASPFDVPAPPPPPEPVAPEPGVQLGFADGSTVTLAEDDPRAVALRAAAARLVSRAEEVT